MNETLDSGLSPWFSAFRERHASTQACFTPGRSPEEPATIAVVGALDSETAGDFFDGAVEALSCLAKGSALELRLEKVRFISSTGVGALTRLLAEAEARGVAMRVAGLSQACKDVFSVLGLLRYFDAPGDDS